MPILLLTIVAGLSLAIWLYLLTLRGGFWRAAQRFSARQPAPSPWPAVAAVIPARDEAEVIARALGSVLDQDYPGPFHVVLADDHSADGTAALARQRAVELGCQSRLTVLPSGELPAGWSGKLWALQQGLEQARRVLPEARYVWFTDADVRHAPDNLRRLVGQAAAEKLDLVSLMVTLSCRGFWERLLIPPFVFFFQKLYPFAWSNDSKAQTAAAAGGCMLIDAEALSAAGGLEPIKARLIDDCALAGLLKPRARQRGRGTWVGLTESAQSIRPYEGLGGIWRMVARTAYTQLRHSPLLLLGTLLGMVLTYLVPPLALLGFPLHRDPLLAGFGLAAWVLMAAAAWPTFRLYHQPFWRCLLLPLAALLYSAMTLDSALRHWRGRGGVWKGRAEARSTQTVAPGGADR
jgi:hopene-associated glycosyltransferase HpnB